MLLTLVWTGVVSRDARAFHPADTFLRTANRGGGSKILYTGSARFRGYDCTMCHNGSSGALSVVVESDPPGLFDGVYKPLEEYTITVEMVGATQPPEGEMTDNLFVAEMVDDAGETVGRFEEIELSSLQRVNGDVNVEGAVFGANDRTRWTFLYAAPAPKAGRISFHLSAVAGDGGASREEPRPPTDPFGDEVFVMSQRACEEFVSCDTSDPTPEEMASPVGHGCSVAMKPVPQRMLFPLMLLATAVVAARRRVIRGARRTRDSATRRSDDRRAHKRRMSAPAPSRGAPSRRKRFPWERR
jgi:hypothetical protein